MVIWCKTELLTAFNGFVHGGTRDSRGANQGQAETYDFRHAPTIRIYFLAQWKETAGLCLCQIGNLSLMRMNCSRIRQTTDHRNQCRASVHWGQRLRKVAIIIIIIVTSCSPGRLVTKSLGHIVYLLTLLHIESSFAVLDESWSPDHQESQCQTLRNFYWAWSQSQTGRTGVFFFIQTSEDSTSSSVITW